MIYKTSLTFPSDILYQIFLFVTKETKSSKERIPSTLIHVIKQQTKPLDSSVRGTGDFDPSNIVYVRSGCMNDERLN